MRVIERITESADRLTTTERRIAYILSGEPQAVAFGTVAEVAQRAGTSGPSVVRLAVKLGYEGFADMQSEIQEELGRQLGRARDRIRQSPPSDLLEQMSLTEQDNVAATLSGVDRSTMAAAVDRLSDTARPVMILSGDGTYPVGYSLWSQLGQLRDGVTFLRGSEVSIARTVATADADTTLVAIDFGRYERWLINMARQTAERGAHLITLTDGALSPLATPAREVFFFTTRGVGPFDSLVPGMALAHALGAAVSARLRQTAIGRLDAIESAWTRGNLLTSAQVKDDSSPNGPRAS